MTYRILQSQERRDRAYESLYQSIWNCAGGRLSPNGKASCRCRSEQVQQETLYGLMQFM